MKKNLSRIIGAALVVAISILFTGCASGGLLTKSQQVVSVPGVQTVVTLGTNSAGAVVPLATNAVPITRLVTNDVWEVSQTAQGYVTTAQGVGNTVAAIAPPAAPAIGAIDAILGVALAGLGLFARIKTKLAARNATAAEKAGAMLRVVVTGVETFNDSKLKELISTHAAVADVAHELHANVQAITAQMVATKP